MFCKTFVNTRKLFPYTPYLQSNNYRYNFAFKSVAPLVMSLFPAVSK